MSYADFWDLTLIFTLRNILSHFLFLLTFGGCSFNPGLQYNGFNFKNTYHKNVYI